jgi:Domain of unknown function (DUF4783)
LRPIYGIILDYPLTVMSMRKLYLAGVLSVWSIAGWAQQDVFTPMKDALKAGSAKELVKYFNQSIDIDLDGDERTYSKVQAELVLREFFKKHVVTDFNIIHNGSSKGGLQYIIGSYISGADRYNVLIRVKDVENEHLIHEIKFRKE